MPLKYINYPKAIRANSKVTGYSLYINHNHSGVFENMYQASREAKKYSHSNNVEIYPVLKQGA